MKTQATIHFQGLNGLRAIAAMAVVISHITLALEHFGLDPYIFGSLPGGEPRGFAMASYGVSIFFVLSGFLITYLLIIEKEAGEINIGKFYIRRILRIWPLYYLYLLAVIIVMLLAGERIAAPTLLFYIFYTANVPFILGTSFALTEHYWSLGVEEQFYLFWPLVVKKCRKYLLTVIIVLLVLLVGTRVVIHFIQLGTVLEKVLEVTRFHCMLLGALGAALYKQQHQLFLRVVDNKITQICCWGVILAVVFNRFHIASVIDDDLVSLVALCLIIGQVNVKNRIINLETNWLDFLGRISYGIYVIHPLLIYALRKPLSQIGLVTPLNYITVYFGITALTIFIAWLSYTYFEKAFLRLKAKYTVVKSSPGRTAAH